MNRQKVVITDLRTQEARDAFEFLKNAGYDGYYTVDFEGMEDPVTGVACGLNTLKAIEKRL